jgi:AcrR family transcriptional regulator
VPRVTPPFTAPLPGLRRCGGDGEGSLRERKKAQTRDAIINAALDLFERQGYEGTTIEEIAAEANISPRTFFRYFDAKLEVIMENSKPELDEIRELVAARPPTESVVEAAHAVFRDRLMSELLDGDTGKTTVRQFQVILATPSLFAAAQEHAREHQDSLVPVLADRLGVAPDSLPAHLAASVITTTVWTCFEHMARQDHANPEELLDLVDEAFAALATLA